MALKDEISYIHSFIRLKKILSATVHVNFFHPVLVPEYRIPPRMLVTFVENGFKHGIYTDPARPVTITMKFEEACLVFLVKNAVGTRQVKERSGIGLENVRQMMELYYRDHYQLELRLDNGAFTCHLRIDLSYEAPEGEKLAAEARENHKGRFPASKTNAKIKKTEDVHLYYNRRPA